MENKSLLKIAYPIFIELSLIMLMGIVDTLMLSGGFTDILKDFGIEFSGLSCVGDNAVGSVGTANTLLNFVVTISNFITIGLIILVSQYVGANRKKELQKVIYSGITAGILVGVFLFCIIFIGSGYLLRLINTPSIQYQYAKDYLKIISISLLVMPLINVNSSIFKGHGYTNITMKLAMIANVLNVFLNATFIFGLFGLPQLGVIGVAWATVISRTILYLVSSVLMRIKLKIILSIKKIFKNANIAIIIKILKIGVPAALEGMAYTFLHMTALKFVNEMVIEADIAATTRYYIMGITSFIYNFTIAIGQSNQILVGQYAGKKLLDKAYIRTIKSLKINLAIILFLSITLYIFAEQVLGFFTKNVRIIELGKNLLLADILLEVARVFNIILGNALKSLGDVRFTFIASVSITLFIGLSASYILVKILCLGLLGAWLGIITEALTRSTAFMFRFRSKKWYYNKTIDD